jgi:hypothetical protein
MMNVKKKKIPAWRMTFLKIRRRCALDELEPASASGIPGWMGEENRKY